MTSDDRFPLRTGIDVVNFGAFAEPAAFLELARDAERAGWDGLFVWDHLAYTWGPPTADPWILLAAAAASTDRITLGTTVTPFPRRRPHEVALAAVGIDRLSGGRAVLGVGLGGEPREYAAFGDPSSDHHRAAALDEALEVVAGLWSGRQVDHRGERYTVDGVTLTPPPLQQPRIPIWVGGDSGPALRRAARWDGWVGSVADPSGRPVNVMDAATVGDRVAAIRRARRSGRPFDVAVIGYSEAGDDDPARRYAAAGATWWLEMLSEMRGSVDALIARVEAGPPRVEAGPAHAGRLHGDDVGDGRG